MNLQKNYFNIMKPQCRSRANIQSLRRRMFIFYEILGLIMKILVSHENLSGFPQMRKSWNPWTWASGANWRYNPRLSFYLASPGSPSFFYWESHSNSWVELTSSHCSLVMPGYSLPSWYLCRSFICSVTEVRRGSRSQFCTCLFFSLWKRQISVEQFFVGTLLTAKELHLTLMFHAWKYWAETTGYQSKSNSMCLDMERNIKEGKQKIREN